MQAKNTRYTLRAIMFVVGAIFFLSGLGYNFLEINPTGKVDVLLMGVGAVSMLAAVYLNKKTLDK